VIVGGAGLRLGPGNLSQALVAPFEAPDVSALSDPAARFFREFAESRAHHLHSLADANPDLSAFGAFPRRRGGTPTPEVVVAAITHTHVPLLVVIGDKDPGLPEAQRLAEAAPNAQIVIIPGWRSPEHGLRIHLQRCRHSSACIQQWSHEHRAPSPTCEEAFQTLSRAAR